MKKATLERPQPQTCAENTKRRSKFKLGATVQLVTGSFAMVVVAVERGGMLKLCYCAPSSTYMHFEHLPEAALIACPPPNLSRRRPAPDIPF